MSRVGRVPLIEDAMFFALGFLISGLLALLFLPAFWRRAVRLSTRRLQMQLPLSMTEIVAERDQLRAEFAIGRRRVEQRAEALSEARARDMAELGRRSIQIAALEGDLAETRAESEERAARIAAVTADLASSQTELGVAHQLHWDAQQRLDRAQDDLREAAERRHALLDIADEARATIAALETRSAGYEADIEGLRRALETARREAAQSILALRNAQDERDVARSDAALAAGKRDQLQTRLQALQGEADDLDRAHRAERRARMKAETEAASVASALSLAEARAASMRDVVAEGRAARADQALRQELEDQRARNASLQGALDAMRRRNRAIGDIGPEGDRPPLADDAALRRAIADVGAKVLRMVEAFEDSQPGARGAAIDQPALVRPDGVQARRESSPLGAAE